MDSLAANYASSDEDADDEGSHEHMRGEGAAKRNPFAVSNPEESSKPLQFAPPKPSLLFSSSLPPPKTSSASLLSSSLPPPKTLSTNQPPPLPSLSEQGFSRAGEEDGVKGQKGGIFSKVTLPKPLFANPSSASRAKLDSNRINDDDGEEDQGNGVFTKVAPSSAPFKAQSSVFSALPQPKTSSSSSLLSSLPPPKTTASIPQKNASGPSSSQNPKKVVQFKLPIDPSLFKRSSFDEDDDDEDEKERDRNQDASSTVSKSFSSLIPAPKQTTLGSAPLGGSSTSRRSIIETDVSAESYEQLDSEQQAGYPVNYGSYDAGLVGVLPPGSGDEGGADSGYIVTSSTDHNWNPTVAGGESWGPVGTEGVSYPGHAGNANTPGWDQSHAVAADYSYGNYENNWYDTSGPVEAASHVADIGRIAGKRGRNEIPVEIIEVKQDELMKNRPRQDKSKLTGSAFGPAYQQPASSTKEKPSKLHKRKHQIGSLFFDMKQKEMELAERRARGLLTKSQTQGKYGW